jgi:SAM-dependent methyltransferase
VGSGNGFFLEEARQRGYETVRGVEPSSAAVERADPAIRPGLVCDVMRPGLFEDGEFDAVCTFQVLDHLPDPAAVLLACRDVLRPGGVFLSLNHDVHAASARVLRERSPIVDIEHTYLFSQSTMRRLFELTGFQVLEQGRVQNTVSLAYLGQLLPVPRRVRPAVDALTRATRLGRVRVRLPLGNQYLIARRPA